jgi:DNA gyrase subunit A
VKGITLDTDDEVIGMEVLEESNEILIVTSNGYGKRTPASEYRIQGRGGKGIKTCHVTDKNGVLVSMKAVTGDEDLMLITTGGVLIRFAVDGISSMGRNTIGVKLISLKDENEYVATVAKVEKEEESSAENEEYSEEEQANTESSEEESNEIE